MLILSGRGGLCLTMFLLGWVEGCSGPILPFLQDYYQVGVSRRIELIADQLPSQHVRRIDAVLTLVSIIYITSFVGGVLSGLTNVYITDRLGFGLVRPPAVGSADHLGCASRSNGPVLVLRSLRDRRSIWPLRRLLGTRRLWLRPAGGSQHRRAALTAGRPSQQPDYSIA